jgi:hypothetical protein
MRRKIHPPAPTVTNDQKGIMVTRPDLQTSWGIVLFAVFEPGLFEKR